MNNKKILIIGASGMLGQRCAKLFSSMENVKALCASIDETIRFENAEYMTVDVTDEIQIQNIIMNFLPDVIINASAYTNVDKSETERDLSWKINVSGVKYMAETAKKIGAHIIHISSDYVFDGKNGPYSESEVPNPINYYGLTKLEGENAVTNSGADYTVIRTNVLYGIIPSGRLDFVRWVVDSIRSSKPIKIVCDQINNPTFIDDLVSAIALVIEKKKFGLYNVGGKEFLDRYEFTMRIADVFNLDKSFVTKIVTEELNQPAPRPLKSGLLNDKAQLELGYAPIDLDESLIRMKNELNL